MPDLSSTHINISVAFAHVSISYALTHVLLTVTAPLKVNVLQTIGKPDKRANQRNKKDKAVGEMLPKTRKLLEEFYNPHNELLSELLGEKFNYNKDF